MNNSFMLNNKYNNLNSNDNYINFYPEDELNDLSDEDKADIKTEIKLSIFEDFNISVKDIFYNIED